MQPWLISHSAVAAAAAAAHSSVAEVRAMHYSVSRHCMCKLLELIMYISAHGNFRTKHAGDAAFDLLHLLWADTTSQASTALVVSTHLQPTAYNPPPAAAQTADAAAQLHLPCNHQYLHPELLLPLMPLLHLPHAAALQEQALAA
ncbi:hypothetical protein COO60DRAFT_493944 [Scenedesmus sp. NREL 46B-D3]|nr:hypothetical protein COO60DRAFT_493944 [Scenedesmus sp. NREL 46B-D3]